MDQHTLVQQIQQGGKAREAALSELYRSFPPRLYGYYMRAGIAPEDVQELVQDVFILIIRKINAFKGGE